MNITYSLYEYNFKTKQTGRRILRDKPLTRAHKRAIIEADISAALNYTDWIFKPAGENGTFRIKGRDEGFIVIASNAGISYETVLKKQTKKTA